MSRFMDAYIEVASEQPKYANVHSNAVKDKPRILAERQSAREREVLEQIEIELNRPHHEHTLGLMRVPVPLPVQQRLTMEPVAIVLSEAIDMALSAAPIGGSLWMAYEAAIGKKLGGLCGPMSSDERMLLAAFSLIPVVGRLLNAGASVAARTIAQAANQTGKPANEVMALVKKAQELKQVQVIGKVEPHAVEVLSVKKPSASLQEVGSLRVNSAQSIINRNDCVMVPVGSRAVPLTEQGGIRVESGGGKVLPASVVRNINRGEKTTELINEVAERTYVSGGAEHAIISLQDGTRQIVSGGTGGISFETIPNLRRILLHTHPTPTGPSAVDFKMLELAKQRSSYIL